jgi:3',5'-cyclic AMP phosphodiesterase CpdA
MNLASEPSVRTKMERMAERVRWRHPALRAAGIDQTRLAVEGAPQDEEAFSFLVLGDSGTGRYRGSSPQRRVAEQLLRHGRDSGFLLHTGDVVYLVGSSEQYRDNFIRPYREWLVGGEDPDAIGYDRMIFHRPFLPVPGNHDYYDLPWGLGLLSGLSQPLRRLLRALVDLDVGWHGSHQGEAYARAFLDVLLDRPERELPAHLAEHYGARLGGERCLAYRPGRFTRLPNRYYQFRWAGVDVIALDSNTFHEPLPVTLGRDRDLLMVRRRELEARRADLLRQAGSLLFPAGADRGEGDTEAIGHDLSEHIEQIDEQLLDLRKQLATTGYRPLVDEEQLDWLEERLVASWSEPAVRGRLLVLHHPPYVSEATKWDQGQTLAIRHHLRAVLDRVAARLGERPGGRPLVDLVLSGHAHCLEVLRSEDTGHGDARIPWVISGGGGYSLRRQRPEGPELRETIDGRERIVARSRLFVGRSGRGSSLRRPYSALRVDVEAGRPLRFRLTPLIAEKARRQWRFTTLDPIRP